MEQEYKWMVRVSCMTYNHAPYITDALNGFCMQETTFPFVCTIIDDASTDGEQEVIKQYLQEHFDLEDKSIVHNEETDDYILTFARHKTNKNCHFAVLYLKYNHYSKPELKGRKIQYISEWQDNCKYVALCEGDDYWIAPNKLQKQVNFLEKNEEYTLCFHNASIKKEKDAVIRKFANRIEDKDYSDTEIFVHFLIPTASAIMRRGVYDSSLLTKFRNDPRINIGDMPTWLTCCKEGKVRGFSDNMSVYRLTSSNWTTKNHTFTGYMKGAERSIAISEIYGKSLYNIAQKQYAMYALAAVSASKKEGHLTLSPFFISLLKYPLETICEVILIIRRKLSKYVGR